MKELNVTMTASEWMMIGAAKDRLGVSLEEFVKQSVKFFASTVTKES